MTLAEPADSGFRMLVDGVDVTDEIRSPEVNAHVSHMARVPAVRDWLLGRLREAARGVDLVADGRDIGTVVFPDAELKIYLFAEHVVRARRRLAQYGVPDPDPVTLAAEVERLKERDRMDSNARSRRSAWPRRGPSTPRRSPSTAGRAHRAAGEIGVRKKARQRGR